MHVKYITFSFIIVFYGFQSQTILAKWKFKKDIISFHTQAPEGIYHDLLINATLGSKLKPYSFLKDPVFTIKDIEWFHPFLISNPNNYGIVFKLNHPSSNKLRNITLINLNKLLAIKFINMPIRAILIDNPVNDGIIPIWGGFNTNHIKLLSKNIPLLEKKIKKKNRKFKLPSFFKNPYKPKFKKNN